MIKWGSSSSLKMKIERESYPFMSEWHRQLVITQRIVTGSQREEQKPADTAKIRYKYCKKKGNYHRFGGFCGQLFKSIESRADSLLV